MSSPINVRTIVAREYDPEERLPDDAAAVLEAGAFADEVRDDWDEAVENDVLGVPAFMLAPGFAIPGAQEVETFKMMLTRVHDRRS